MYQLKTSQATEDLDGAPHARGVICSANGNIGEWLGDMQAGLGQVTFTSLAQESAFAAWATDYLANCRDFEDKPYAPAAMTKAEVINATVLQMSYAAFDAALDGVSAPGRKEQANTSEFRRSCLSCGACRKSSAPTEAADRGLMTGVQVLSQCPVRRPAVTG